MQHSEFHYSAAAELDVPEILRILYRKAVDERGSDSGMSGSRKAEANPATEVQAILEVYGKEPLPQSHMEKSKLINDLVQAEGKLVQMMEKEAEIIETEKWNHDAVVQLMNLATIQKRIPFDPREVLFDLHPTAKSYTEPSSTNKRKTAEPTRKGKERQRDTRRSIYHILPEDFKDSWTGQTCKCSLLTYYFF